MARARPRGSRLILAQHRSGFLALAVALAGTALFLVGSGRMLRGLLRITVGGAAALAGYVLVFGGSYLDDTYTRILHTFDTADSTAAWRLLSWYEVGSGVVDRPLGHGFATWDFYFNIDDPLRGSHNSFLDLAYRAGVPGLVAFLAMPIALTVGTRSVIRQRPAADNTLLVTVCACMYRVPHVRVLQRRFRYALSLDLLLGVSPTGGRRVAVGARRHSDVRPVTSVLLFGAAYSVSAGANLVLNVTVGHVSARARSRSSRSPSPRRVCSTPAPISESPIT